MDLQAILLPFGLNYCHLAYQASRRYPLPPGKLSIDVDVARAFQHTGSTYLPSRHTPMRSPYGDVVPSPGPTYEYFPRHEVHSAVTQCATEHLMTLN
jgi:hypothetical protein